MGNKKPSHIQNNRSYKTNNQHGAYNYDFLLHSKIIRANSCDSWAVLYFRMRARTSSRFSAICSGVLASRLRRTSGSVFDERTLNHQSAYS